MSALLLDDRAMRCEGARYDLYDPDGNLLGQLHPQRSPSLSNAGSGTVKRTLTNFTLGPDEAADVDVFTARVRPVWIIDGTEYPLGTFLWNEASESVRGYGSWMPSTLFDQGLVLAQRIDRTVGFGAGALASDAIRSVCEMAGFFDAAIDASSATIGSPVAWQAGKDSWGKVLSDLCATAGLHDWYFTSAGVLTFRTITDLSGAVPTLVYGAGGRVVEGSISRKNDLLAAPNRFVAVDTSATNAPIVGVYDLPPEEAPHAVARRRFAIPDVFEVPGLGTVEAAEEAARNRAMTTPKAYETVTFASAIDPRHETFDAVSFYGVTYLEASWSMALTHGGAMTHELRRVYLT